MRIAGKRDASDIIALWREVFDEDIEVCCEFYRSLTPSEDFNALVHYDGETGVLASALFLLPCRIKDFNGLCVYCAMTKKEFRGRGIMKQLLELADRFRRERGLDFLFLVPAEKSLFSYYERCGFIPFGKKSSAVLKIGAGNGKSADKISAREYISQREKNLGDTPRLYFNDKITEYWTFTCRHYGGSPIGTDSACAMCFPEGNKIILRDVTGQPDSIKALINGVTGDILAEGFDLPFDASVSVHAAMLKTDSNAVKTEITNADCYIGITLE